MEERTHISASSVQFVNDLIKEVCLNGKSLSKFRSEISKNFPDDENIYGEIEEFVDTVKSVSKGEKEIDAAFLELRTAAQHIFLTTLLIIVELYHGLHRVRRIALMKRALMVIVLR